jgi:two-component system, NtrC family, sensor histidine kinase PilS
LPLLSGSGRRLNWILVGRLSVLGVLSALGIGFLGAGVVGLAFGLTAAAAVVTTTLTASIAGRRSILPAGLLPYVDSLLLGVIVHYAGGVDGPFSIFFFVHALYAGNVLGTRGGFYCALLDTLVLAASGQLMLMHIGPSAGSSLLTILGSAPGPDLTYSYLGLRVLLHACLLVTAGLVSGYLTERLRSQSGRLRDALDALRTSNARSRDILESLSDGILVFDSEGEPIGVNSSAKQMLGLGADWENGVRSAQIYPILRRFRSEGSFPDVMDLVQAGRIFECRMGRYEHENSDSPGVLLVLTDVTELRNLRGQLAEREKLAVIGRLSATMAHEIRNPLASISGAAQVIRSGCEVPIQERMTDLIVGQARRASDIIEGYLELARGSRPREDDEVHLEHVVYEAAENARNSYASGVDIRTGAVPEAIVRGREQRLLQLLGNLLRNASEALEGVPGGTIDISLAPDRLRGCAKLTISDNGPGMPGDALARATEPFYSTRQYGTGLGLYVVRRVVDEHGGELHLRNRPEGGFEVTVVLPLAGHEAPGGEP